MTKISVIGAGFVGSTGTYALMLKEVADEIALIDINADLVAAEVADINQGFKGLSKTRVKIGSYADCSNSDLIIVTAGLGRKIGESRLDLLNKTIKIMEEISAQINKTDTKDIPHLRYALYQHKAGETIEITYIRDGKEHVTKVTLGKNTNKN